MAPLPLPGQQHWRTLNTNLCLSGRQCLDFILCRVLILRDVFQLLAQIQHFQVQQLQVRGVFLLDRVQLILQKSWARHRGQSRKVNGGTGGTKPASAAPRRVPRNPLLAVPVFCGFSSFSFCRRKMFLFKDSMRFSKWHIRFTRNSQFFHDRLVLSGRVTSLGIGQMTFWLAGSSKEFEVLN